MHKKKRNDRPALSIRETKEKVCKAIIQFTCKVCSYNTTKRKYFLNHEKLQHSERVIKQIFSCDQCTYQTDQSRNIKRHEIIIHDKLTRFICSACPFKAYLRSSIERHIGQAKIGGTHSQAKLTRIGIDPATTHAIRCDQCDFSTKLEKNLNAHKRIVHGREKRYACSVCQYKSFKRHSVNKHIECHPKELNGRILTNGCIRCIENENHYQCFFGPEVSKKVRKDHGKSIELLNCDKCNFETNYSFLLLEHRRDKHLNEKRFSCHICDHKTFYSSNMNSHYNKCHLNEPIDMLRTRKRRKLTPNEKQDMKEFFCSLCNTKSSQKIMIKNHQNEAHKNKASVVLRTGCHGCTLGSFHNRCSLKRKTFRVREGQESLKCSACDFSTYSSKSLKAHNESIHQGTKRFVCSVCPYESYHRHVAVIHQKSNHANQECKVNRIGCQKCVDGVIHPCSVDGREQLIHMNEDETFSCSLCEFKQHSYISVKYHIIKKHSLKSPKKVYRKTGGPKQKRKESKRDYKERSPSPKSCSYCNYETSSKQLPIHIKKEHPLESLYLCDTCHYKTNWIANLRTHIASKHDGAMFKCDLCDYSNKWKPPYYLHRREKHGIFMNKSKYREDLEMKDIMCDKCGFKALSKRELRYHVDSDCKLSLGIEVNHCDKCPYTTQYRHNMNTHKEAMHGGKDYACDQCDHTAYLIRDLKIHKKYVHDFGSNSLICKLCNYKTTYPQNLRTHEKSQHEIK